MPDTIKAILVDPDAHAGGADGVQAVELPTQSDGRSLDTDEVNRILDSEYFESASSLLRGSAKNASLFVNARAPDDGAHWCWTWDTSEPVIGKGLIVGT